jgi:F-box and WD-40 domain protein CDC4
MDIPTMVDAFDSMPEAMQTYLMYQFLRRCAKPTLLMVASVVNPALKCDPFNILPPELSLNIARFLDAQSMCRAAQVSKRWRRLIITNEKAWKDLLERDEFTLPVDEISRAVREGWGWQHPGIKGYEEDLSAEIPLLSSDARDDSTISDDELTASSSTNSRSMKKRAKISGSKKAKRRTGQASSALVKPAATLQAKTKLSNLLDSAKGASAFAHAATVAIPHPSIGLDSLRNMHLFKSLYQRHYLIRKAWMSEKSKPKHLAFRAHHRHVVTCLLFDSDKILTGSDDTKINVYDTETGALRRRLDGHEGGVWALQYEGNMLVSGSTDRTVRVWDIEAGRCLQVFQGHTSTVRCLVILKPAQIGTAADGTPIMMPKEPLIITGSRDSTLRVWRLPGPHDANVTQNASPITEGENPYFLRTLAGHHNSVRAIAAHGDTLASGSYDCTVRVWKISTGDLVHRLAGHTSKVYSVVLDHARNRCISGSMDNFVKIWDLNNGTSLYTLDGHTSLVGLLDLSHDRLVSAAADSTLRLWDPETGAPRATLSAHTGAITCFQHDGQKVISGSDRTLKMWNVKNGEFVRDLLTDLSGVWQVRFDERRCVAAVQRNNLTYIEVRSLDPFVQ